MGEFLSEPLQAALVGLFGGVLLGLAARIGRFCTLGAIEDMLYGGSDLRMRMWILAIGVAVLGSFGLIGSGLLAAEETLYLGRAWAPLGSVLGGGLFGYGMALAGNCGYGAIARLGGGDLRAFVIVIVLGISAYATIAGPLAPVREILFPDNEIAPDALPGIAHALAGWTGASPAAIGVVIGLLICVAALSSRAFRAAPDKIFWAVVVGLAIVSGWAGTAWIAENGFDATAVVSHSFSAPVGDALLYTMLASAMTPGFAVGSVVGVALGAFAGSLFKGQFRWEACEDPRELRRQIIGAAVMGVGAVTAVGCTVGQGLSAFSLLAFSAPLTFAAIFAGAALGLKQLISGFQLAE